MTSNQGDIHNHLPGARQEAVKGSYEFTVVAKLSIGFGNELSKFQGVANTSFQTEQSSNGQFSSKELILTLNTKDASGLLNPSAS